ISGGLGYILAGRTLQPIKDMVDEQNRFISDSSHELRTPLTSLKTAMEVTLRDKNLSLQQAKKLISENIGEVNKLQSLSDQLLRLAQFEKPNGKLQFGKVSLEKIIKEAIRKIDPLAKQKQISIKKDLKDVEIKGNKDSLVDLFVILLDNAVKYSPSGSKVEVKSEKADATVLVSVKDEGIGIDEKDFSHIFDRFFRADSARSKDKADGYGLGLSIAKKIVNLHKGTIKVKSKISHGSTFIIQLPIHKS
ncbi:HAMP domain-containing histidine kinase, partial [Candidatus Roizmanbacteria bacterium]|nr:HAMP domain-containing histidine kinase [Candidatus Roizmanbacteria bacterium]